MPENYYMILVGGTPNYDAPAFSDRIKAQECAQKQKYRSAEVVEVVPVEMAVDEGRIRGFVWWDERLHQNSIGFGRTLPDLLRETPPFTDSVPRKVVSIKTEGAGK